VINLAGNKESDTIIKQELLIAKIPIITGVENKHTEVPQTLIGVMGGWYAEPDVLEGILPSKPVEMYYDYYRFVFVRAWYYWTVKGAVPMVVAQELYNNEYGKTDIRADGHCGCPSPDRHSEYGRYYHAYPYDGVLAKESDYLSVNSYHIDSQIGLCIFVDTLRKYGLDKRPRLFRMHDPKEK
jgi:hypothetical protein